MFLQEGTCGTRSLPSREIAFLRYAVGPAKVDKPVCSFICLAYKVVLDLADQANLEKNRK